MTPERAATELQAALMDTGPVGCASDPDSWFADGDSKFDPRPAVRICNRCPVIAECLAYGLTHDVDGVWGGLDRSSRKHMARRAGIAQRHLTAHHGVYDAPRPAGDDQ